MSWVIVAARTHGAKRWGACGKHDRFSGQLEKKEHVQDALPWLHRRSNWYSATWDETLPSINESTFRMHSGPDRFHHFAVILMTKPTLFFKSFFLFSSSFRGKKVITFQKMFSIQHRNLIFFFTFLSMIFLKSYLKTKSYMNCPLFYSKNKWFYYICLQNELGTSSSDFESQSTSFPTSIKWPATLHLALDVDLNYEKKITV